MTFKDALLRSAKRASEAMEALSERRYSGKEAFSTLILRYILNKFLLEELCPDTDDLDALARKSVEHIIRLVGESGFDFTDAPGCTGVSSAAEKKALLLLSIRKSLKIAAPIEDMVAARTIADLSEYLYNLLNA